MRAPFLLEEFRYNYMTGLETIIFVADVEIYFHEVVHVSSHMCIPPVIKDI